MFKLFSSFVKHLGILSLERQEQNFEIYILCIINCIFFTYYQNLAVESF